MLSNRVVLIFLNICLVASHILDKNNVKQSDRDLRIVDHNLQSKSLNIIGGKGTTIEKHPYQASITLPYDFVAGAILNKRWILSTAGILSIYNGTSLSARVGSNYTNTGGVVYQIEKMVFHPEYNTYNSWYDFVLLKLSKPLKFKKTVKKVQLPSKELKEGQKAVVSGWGATTMQSVTTNPFKEITLSAVSYATCQPIYSSTVQYSMSESQACAVAQNPKNGPSFDFGAPLVLKNKLYGQYSFRYTSYDIPVIFTNIVKALSWIKKTIKT